MSVVGMLCLQVLAQETEPATIPIGGTVPNITFDYLLNYSESEISLSDLKGKWVIIDFWSPYCSTCIKGMPSLDSIQKLNPALTKIILVTDSQYYDREQKAVVNSRDVVNTILQKVSNGNMDTFSLPAALTDIDRIRRIFNYTFIPSYFIINPGGRLVAVTTSTDVVLFIIHSISSKISN